MSLNRCEQRIFDYLHGQPEEKRFWQEKVRGLAARLIDPAAAGGRLEIELWRYYEERSAVVPAFRDAVRSEGLRRTSLRNLAELLLRLWTEPPPKRRAPAASGEGKIL